MLELHCLQLESGVLNGYLCLQFQVSLLLVNEGLSVKDDFVERLFVEVGYHGVGVQLFASLDLPINILPDYTFLRVPLLFRLDRTTDYCFLSF